MPAPIQLFLTTIASAPVLRQKQEYLLRTLQVKRIPFVSYDLASDENAKRLWRRKAPKDHQTLPGILVANKWPGTFEEFEKAVEQDTLEVFLKLKQDYDPELDGRVLAAQPVGVPGAATPMEMTGHKPSRAPGGPTPMKKSGAPGTGDELLDAGDILPGYGFQGLKVTMNELADLAKDLGLDDKDPSTLAKRLSHIKDTREEHLASTLTENSKEKTEEVEKREGSEEKEKKPADEASKEPEGELTTEELSAELKEEKSGETTSKEPSS